MAAPAFPGLHRIVIRAERLDDVVARPALKRMQVGTQECRHDLGEHHLGLALRTGRTLNGSERNDGRQGGRFCHNASFEERECNTWDRRSCPAGGTPTMRMPVRLPVLCSILLSFRKLLPAFFRFSTESFSVHQNPEIYLQKRTARLSPAVQ